MNAQTVEIIKRVRALVVKQGFTVRCNRPLRTPNYDIFIWNIGLGAARLYARTAENAEKLSEAIINELGYRVSMCVYDTDHIRLDIEPV